MRRQVIYKLTLQFVPQIWICQLLGDRGYLLSSKVKYQTAQDIGDMLKK